MSDRKMLHFGVDVTTLHEVARLVESWGRDVEVDGDGWEAWGEPIGHHGNDARTVHVMLRGYDNEVTQDAMALARAVSLVPFQTGGFQGVAVVATDVDDHSTGVSVMHLADLV